MVAPKLDYYTGPVDAIIDYTYWTSDSKKKIQGGGTYYRIADARDGSDLGSGKIINRGRALSQEHYDECVDIIINHLVDAIQQSK